MMVYIMRLEVKSRSWFLCGCGTVALVLTTLKLICVVADMQISTNKLLLHNTSCKSIQISTRAVNTDY